MRTSLRRPDDNPSPAGAEEGPDPTKGALHGSCLLILRHAARSSLEDLSTRASVGPPPASRSPVAGQRSRTAWRRRAAKRSARSQEAVKPSYGVFRQWRPPKQEAAQERTRATQMEVSTSGELTQTCRASEDAWWPSVLPGSGFAQPPMPGRASGTMRRCRLLRYRSRIHPERRGRR